MLTPAVTEHVPAMVPTVRAGNGKTAPLVGAGRL